MQLTCPECHVDCTIDEHSVETASCPGCGLLLYSKSGRSGALAEQVAAKSGQKNEPSQVEIEQTKLWQRAIDEALPVLDEFPTQLGRYQLRQKLGMGSFAEVFLAFDTELGREVALKIPRRHRFSTAQQLNRFLDEARTSAILEHPGIVRVYDIGWLSDEVCFISMEHCAGGTLSDRLKLGLFTTDQAVELLSSLAEAIHFAHLNGFVHRDLKPSNIMFGRDGKPRIVDFGLAISDETQLKLIGEVAGTLPYMSPEQLSGNTHHLDGRTDIWSLGIIFYQLLTGRRPFNGTRDLIIDQIRHRDAKPPRQVKDDVPVELETICLRCLEKSPADRFATGKDLALQLRATCEATSTLATAETVENTQSPQGTLARRKTVLWLLALLLPLAVSFLALNTALTKPHTESVAAPAVVKSTDPDAQKLNVLPFELGSKTHGTGEFKWYHLLDRSPKPYFVCDPRWDPATEWSYQTARQTASLTSQQRLLLSMGEAMTDSFSLDVSFHSPAFTENAETGIFWGGYPLESTPKYRQGNMAHALIISVVRDEKMQPVVHVNLQRMAFWQSVEGFPTANTWGIGAVVLPRPDRPDFRLTVKIVKAGVLDLAFNGQSYSQFKDATIRSPDESKQFRSRGTFGAYNSLGSTVFDRFEFQPLN